MNSRDCRRDVRSSAMAHPSGDHPPRYPAGVAALIECGTLIPARRRLSEVLAAHPPLKLERSQCQQHERWTSSAETATDRGNPGPQRPVGVLS